MATCLTLELLHINKAHLFNDKMRSLLYFTVSSRQTGLAQVVLR
jgi:hypothetical protein